MGLTGKRMAEEAGAGIAAGSVVGVVGAGVMGTGIAQVAALAGHAVRLYNHRPGKADKAVADIGRALARLVEKGRLDAAAAGAARARIEVAGSLQALAGAAFVIESVIEDLDVKRSVFTALEDIVDAGCILATNTSSLSVTAIGGVLARPQRLVGLHFFNPAPLMALVEVVRGLATDPQVAATAYATVAAWGKQPVHAASTPGFIVNRVARPYYGEALRLLTEGAGDAATIDAVLRECGGFRMGPFELMDLVGTDINLAVTQAVFDGFFNDPRYAPSLVQREMVSAGFLGRKTGRGYYRYGDDAVQPAPRTEPHAPAPAGACIAPAYEALRARLQAAGIACTVADAGGPACLHIGGAQVWLTDGRSATQRAFDDAHPDTILFDLLADPGTAPRVALARADGCADGPWRAAVGLFQAAGCAVTRIDDVPGMVVMRVVAMLANEAADAVNGGVCSASAVDAAMRLGVNYPRGPLAWADAIGLAHVHTVLTHLAATYGADRYRISPLLRRRLYANPLQPRFHASTHSQERHHE
jgi:3-hydroxybutyryl-CoA dehydrogenase